MEREKESLECSLSMAPIKSQFLTSSSSIESESERPRDNSRQFKKRAYLMKQKDSFRFGLLTKIKNKIKMVKQEETHQDKQQKQAQCVKLNQKKTKKKTINQENMSKNLKKLKLKENALRMKRSKVLKENHHGCSFRPDFASTPTYRLPKTSTPVLGKKLSNSLKYMDSSPKKLFEEDNLINRNNYILNEENLSLYNRNLQLNEQLQRQVKQTLVEQAKAPINLNLQAFSNFEFNYFNPEYFKYNYEYTRLMPGLFRRVKTIRKTTTAKTMDIFYSADAVRHKEIYSKSQCLIEKRGERNRKSAKIVKLNYQDTEGIFCSSFCSNVKPALVKMSSNRKKRRLNYCRKSNSSRLSLNEMSHSQHHPTHRILAKRIKFNDSNFNVSLDHF
jgi:hypothetical protein